MSAVRIHSGVLALPYSPSSKVFQDLFLDTRRTIFNIVAYADDVNNKNQCQRKKIAAANKSK